jgi:hypothetical protein
MKEEVTLQSDLQEQDASHSDSKSYASSAPITSVAPLVDSEVEPSTSALQGSSDTSVPNSTSETTPAATASPLTAPIKKRMHMGLIIGLIIGICVLLVCAGIAAYMLMR